MMDFSKSSVLLNIIRAAPLILLIISVLNEFNLNYAGFISINFPYILIYYWTLKRSESLGHGYIFLAGLINDVVVGLPIGISALNYLLICGFAGYLKNITLRAKLIQDWFFFLFTILVVNSISFSILILFFSLDLIYSKLLLNIMFTFSSYIIFAYIFSIYQKTVFKEKND